MAVSQSLTLTQRSQSVANNTSVVRITWATTQSGESRNGYTRTAYYYVSINGGAETRYSVSYTLPANSTKTLVSKDITVAHKADGKGSVKVRTWMDTDISAGVIEKSASLSLTTIPRATTPTLSASSVDMGASVTISLPRAASSFTHDLAYKLGSGSYVAVASDVGTSYTWTVPDIATSLPNAASGTVTLRIITKSGSTTIGTKTKTLTVKVPASVIPAVSSVVVTDGVADVADLIGALVQNKSKARVTINAAGAKGSTVQDYSATLLGKTYTGKTWTSDLLTSDGTVAVKVRVKDSRGRWSEYKTQNITVLPYYKPKISRMDAYRCDENGTPQDDGLYMFLDAAYSVAPLNNKNTASMSVQYKRSTAGSYVETPIVASTSLSYATKAKVASPTFSSDYTFDVRMTVTDAFGASSVYTTVLPSDAVIMDISADGLGLALGKTSEQPGIEFGWDIVGAVRQFGTMSGHYRSHDGLLMQWGLVSITPTAAGTPTSVLVNYPQAFADTPAVFAALATSVPHSVAVGIQRTASIVPDTKKGIAITLTRDNVTNTGVYWLAIGRGA